MLNDDYAARVPGESLELMMRGGHFCCAETRGLVLHWTGYHIEADRDSRMVGGFST